MKILSRRNAMYAALIAAAVSSAIATAVATTAVATGAPMIKISAGSASAVSPRMASLVAAYKQAVDMVDALAPDPSFDPEAWEALEEKFLAAQAALMNEKPATAADYAAKFDALLELDSSEGEFAVIKRLSEDAHALAGAN